VPELSGFQFSGDPAIFDQTTPHISPDYRKQDGIISPGQFNDDGADLVIPAIAKGIDAMLKSYEILPNQA
ncbi:hypothetical protein ABTA40_19500, partial [Acinetobacter baumannii]|jgi:hypothetical protein